MRGLLAALLFTGMGVSTSQAQIERQHGAHVHGEGQASLAFDGSAWTLSLEMPGFNVVGFEHAPNNDQQQQALSDAMAALEQGAWLSFNSESQCRAEAARAQSMGYASTEHVSHNHDRRHNHDHEHNEDHGHADGHARFEIEVQGVCERTDRLAWWGLDLFDGFPNNEAISVAVLTQSQAFEAVLTPKQQRIVFD